MSDQLGQEAAQAALAAKEQAQAAPTENTDAPVQESTAVPVPDETSADAGADKGEVTAKPESGDSEPLAKTGDSVLDAGIEMMQKVAGLNAEDVSRIFAKANASGNATDIDKEYIKDRFGEHASYIEQLATAYVSFEQTKSQDVVNQIHEKVGGAERWDLLNQTFKANAPQHFQLAVKALADAGNFNDAADVIIGFSESSGLVPVEKGVLKGGAASDSALSAKEFTAEYAKLREAAGPRSLESGKFADAYQSLVRRRALGKSKGI